MPRPLLCFVLSPEVGPSQLAGFGVELLASLGVQPVVETFSLARAAALTARMALCDLVLVEMPGCGGSCPDLLYHIGRCAGMMPGRVVLVGDPLPEAPAGVVACALPLPAGEDAAKSRLQQVVQQALSLVGQPSASLATLLGPWTPSGIARLKTDLYRQQVQADPQMAARLARARAGKDLSQLARIQNDVQPFSAADPVILVDLLLSWRAVGAVAQMVDLVPALPPELQRTVMVQEQYAFALNRAGQDEAAETILLRLIDTYGPGTETNGLLGRLYKDRWTRSKDNNGTEAAIWLDKAIATYHQGFEQDWRDAYPGINAVMLMEQQTPPHPRQKDLLPLVRYAVQRRLDSGAADYWDYASRLELAVLARDYDQAGDALAAALARMREGWEGDSTLRTLRQTLALRQHRDGGDPALQSLITRMEQALALWTPPAPAGC